MNEYSWTDLRVGLRHGFEVTITPEMMEAFAVLSGDCNPLHVDAAFAVKAGFRGNVVFGMLTASFYSRLVGVYLPGKHALLHGIDLDFQSPTFVGDTLIIDGEIAFLSDAYRQIEIKARSRNQHGKLISKAVIRVGLLGQ
jgi:3-hydroxybutyryl-CoA dehydratase